jgi:hypothetical protein
MAYKFKMMISPANALSKRAVKAYVCDTPDDVRNLPKVGVKGTQVLNDGEDHFNNEECNYGSEATAVEPFSGFVLNASNEWKQVF